ncbi:MAG: hypothetical protein VKJ46_12065, partial [Leptolyngbyaceae bacterium]|nr:hypothetical protein [Leptolyngbyaceae bacterium]
TNILSDPTLIENVKLATKNTSDAAAGVAKLTNQVTGLAQTLKQELVPLSNTAQTSLMAAGRAANEFENTATQLNSLIAANRSTLTATLTDLSQTSRQIRRTVSSLTPLISRVEQGELIRNLEVLSANAAQASTNLRDVSNALNSPTNILALQQTLDAARVTFQNAQKITSDLDELTGDPMLRNNLRNLINGLSGLVSSTEHLQQQAQLAQLLSPTAAPTPITLKPMPKLSLPPSPPIMRADKLEQKPSQPTMLVPEVVLPPRLSTSETVNLNQ